MCLIILQSTRLTNLYSLERKSQVHEIFRQFVHEVGIPHELHSDNTRKLVMDNFKKNLNKYKFYISATAPYPFL